MSHSLRYISFVSNYLSLTPSLSIWTSLFFNSTDTAILSILILCSFYLPFLFCKLRLTCSINSFSLSVDASPTLSSYVPLSNLYHLCLCSFISCPFSLLLSLPLLFCYCFSITHSLTFSVSSAQYLDDFINIVFVFDFNDNFTLLLDCMKIIICIRSEERRVGKECSS